MTTKTVFAAAALILAGLPVFGQTPAVVNQLIDRIVANEQDFLNRMKGLQPILETYLQEMPENGDPEADHYMVGKLDFSDGVEHIPFAASPAFRKRGFLRRGGPISFSPSGFAQMVILDDETFDRNTYSFDYVRQEFLGELRCLVFDLTPVDRKAAGKFIGRIWVEDRDSHIVRFNGTYTGSKASSLFFHFDSWRVNVAPGLYVPAFVYIEDANTPVQGARRLRLKGQIRVWGYNAVLTNRWDELTNILVDAANPVRDRSGSHDPTPVESQRAWERQAQDNVLQRLEKTGLLAPKGDVEQVLNAVVNNLMATNDINLDVECRVLMTTPLETFSIGRRIVISRGLLDVLPDEASLAVVLSDELAHIVLGHRTETMFAFSDRTMFAESETLDRLRFGRSSQEVEAANVKALAILQKSPYKDKLAQAGLFLKAVGERAPKLTHLIQAHLGNQFASGASLVRLAELARQAPAIENGKIEQISALPLGSRIKVDPWSNKTTLIPTRPIELLSPREKMPFEITPVIPYLTRVDPGAAERAAGPK